jgi:hypothetical protein
MTLPFPRAYIQFHTTPVIPATKKPKLSNWPNILPDFTAWQPGDLTGVVCGDQGWGQLIVLDFDHKPDQGIDASANFQAFVAAVSFDTLCKLFVTTSTSGSGYHVWVYAPRDVAKGIIRNAGGKKIGDLLGTGGQVIAQTEDHWICGHPQSLQELTADEIDQLLRLVNYRAPVAAGGDTARTNPQRVQELRQRMDALCTNGLPSRMRPTSHAAYYITHEAPAYRTSEIRFEFIEELIRCGYDDDETTAFALAFADFGASTRKGLTWLATDVARIIAKVRANGVRVRRPATQAALPVEAAGGVAIGHHLLALREHLRRIVNRGKNEVVTSLSEIADDLGKSRRTIIRWVKDGIAKGLWQHKQDKQGRTGYFILPFSGGDTPDCTQVVNPATEACWGECEGGTAAVSPPDVAPPARPEPILSHVIEDAVTAAWDVRSKRVKEAEIIGYVYTHGFDYLTFDEIRREAERETRWQRQRRADEHYKAKLRTMTDTQLRGAQKGAERRAAEAHAKGSPGQAWVFGRLSWFIQREWERREPLRRALRDPNGPSLLGDNRL